jgi:hypothetical protein
MYNPEAKRRGHLLSSYNFNLTLLSTGCCPNGNPFELSLKRFLPRNLGEVEDRRCQLFEPSRRVLTSPGASLRFIKKRFRPSEKDFGNSLSKSDIAKSRKKGHSSCTQG